MCGFCHAMTPRESERFYELVHAGEVTDLPRHVAGDGSPRKDLRERVLEELQAGDYDDSPAFKKALIHLCGRADPKFLSASRTLLEGFKRFAQTLVFRGPISDMHSFERQLVALRHSYKRPVLSDEEVRGAVKAAEERRANAQAFEVEMQRHRRPAKVTRETVI